jgi:uncharacterized protein YutD
MSGNVNDTDADKINRLAEEMLNDIKNGSDEQTLLTRYRWLNKKFPSIYNYIQSDPINFEMKNLRLMLNMIKKVQNNETTVDNASKLIGTKVAKDYIPEYILQDKQEPKN